MPPKRKSHLDRLKEKLYSPRSAPKQKARSPIYEDEREAPSEWKHEPATIAREQKSLLSNTMFKKFFLGAIAFFSLAVIFGAFMFFGESNTVSADNIEINVLGNAFVSGGEALPLKIEIINKNNVSLEYSDLLLEYQKGAGVGESIQRDRFTVGTVPAGGVSEKLLDLVLFGQQGTTRDINIVLEYRVPGSSAIFVKEELYVVNISSTPLNLSVKGPEVSNTNQEIAFDIVTSLNTEEAAENMMVVVDYPPGFDWKRSTPEPTFSNNIWFLGDLDKGAEKTIRVEGVIVAEAGESRAFNIYAGTADPNDEQTIGTQFNSESYRIAIEQPFLDLALSINGSVGAESVAIAGQSTEGSINFSNSLDAKITDVEITAQFSGSAFDPDSISSDDGFYDSSTRTIIWNRETSSRLGTIDPGDRGELSFSFRPLPLSGSSTKNPEIVIDLSIRGRKPELGNSFLEIENFIKKTVKFGTQLSITGHALYNSGPFQNSGPIPPTPGQSTTYTIVWSIANTINRVSGATVKATLPLYVEWVGATSPSGQSITYNAPTREVTWNIGTVEAGVGTSSSPRQVNFQVRLNPSSSQSGTAPNLVSDTVLTARDVFTNVDIVRSLQPITTRLNRDSNYNSQHDTVQ